MRLFLLSYKVDDDTSITYFSVDVNEDGLQVKVRTYSSGARAISIVPNKWNMIDIEVFEDPIDDIVKFKFSRKADDVDEISTVFALWDSQYFNLSPKSSHYSKKQFDLEFRESHLRQRSWIKDLTFIG